MTSSHYGPYRLGYTCATKDNTKSQQQRELEQIYKVVLSTDYSLKLENMKQELLVIVNKSVTVNFFSDLVHTARHAWEVSFILSFYDSLINIYCKIYKD